MCIYIYIHIHIFDTYCILLQCTVLYCPNTILYYIIFCYALWYELYCHLRCRFNSVSLVVDALTMISGPCNVVYLLQSTVLRHIFPFFGKVHPLQLGQQSLVFRLAATGRLNRMKCFLLRSSLGVSRGEGKSVLLSGRCIVGCLQSLWCAGHERTIGWWDASVLIVTHCADVSEFSCTVILMWAVVSLYGQPNFCWMQKLTAQKCQALWFPHSKRWTTWKKHETAPCTFDLCRTMMEG